MDGDGNNPIYPFYPLGSAHGWSLRHILDKFTKGTFYSTSNEVIWPKIFSNFMHGLKSAILAIFQQSADWLDWPCPVSAALQNGSQDFFSLLYLNFHLFFFKYETIVRSSAWSFGHSDPNPSSVNML